MNDGQGNWSKLYMPGKETPLSLLRFSPHDEEAKLDASPSQPTAAEGAALKALVAEILKRSIMRSP